MPEKLAIVIPTYTRVAALAANLPFLLEDAERLGVGVYLSDDSPDDATERLAAPLLVRYANFHYRRNIPALRHDANILSTLAWPDADHVWILGDVFRPKEGGLAAVLDFLNNQDFLFINWASDDTGMIRSAEGEVAHDLLLSKLWHQTLTGATIFRRPVIAWAEASLTRPHANFPHLDVILGYVEAHPVVIGWFGRKILHAEQKTASYWRARALDVFIDDWVSVVKAHPQAVPPSSLKRVLRSHSASTKLFSIGFLRELARSGHFGIAALRRPHFWDVMHESRLRVLSALLLPDRVYRRLLGMKYQSKE